MTQVLKQHYGPAAGPLGFPMLDRQAQALDQVLKALPKDTAFAYRKAELAEPPREVSAPERTDVSWISTEAVDRAREVVIARGLKDDQFGLNPVVTLQHSYGQPPVGRSLWRKKMKTPRPGVLAKTVYPIRPQDLPETEAWPPDGVFALVAAGLLNGKSIGFLPLKVHEPTPQEREKNGWGSVSLVIDEWLLLEYACVVMPCNQECVVTADVAKQVPPELARQLRLKTAPAAPPAPPEPAVPFVTLSTLERAVRGELARLDVTALGERATREALDRARGRV